LYGGLAVGPGQPFYRFPFQAWATPPFYRFRARLEVPFPVSWVGAQRTRLPFHTLRTVTSMDIHEYPRISTWIFMDWISADIHGYPLPRISMDIHEYPWISMDIH
jgi:hypothetical protein